MYALKKDLGDGWVQVQGDLLQATSELVTDVGDFQRAVESGDDEGAVAQYAGGFLDGANLTTSRAYEGWVDRIRARMAREYRNAAARVVEAKEASGDVAGALAVARTWVDGDPLDDEAQHLLIELLARSGRRSEALRQYDQYAELLERELEVEPLEQTRDLVARIREEGAPSPAAGAGGWTPAPPEASPGPPAPHPQGSAVPAAPPTPPAAPDGSGDPVPTRDGEEGPRTALDALIQFADELSRRRVNRVAIAYLVVALATLEGTDLLLSPFGLPSWFNTALSVVVLLGFPVVLAVAWVFDITPRGLEVTQPVEGGGAVVASRLARRALVGVIAVSLVGLVGLWAYRQTVDAPVFDLNRVMVFPLVTPASAAPAQASLGEDVATMIGHALDRTGPLRWIDGWSLLQPEERDDIRQLTTEEARLLAASRQCAFFVLGRVVPLGASDSTRVLLELWDAAGDSTIADSEADGPAGETWQTGLRAVSDLLPTIVGGAIPNDFEQEVSNRNPTAVASFLLGEQAFRRAQGEVALLHYWAAVAEDSLFALATIRGAQAAAWEHDYDAMEALSERALTLDLSPSERHVAIGMVAHSEGRGDSAIAAFDRAITEDSANALAWAQKGEVLSHLAPRTARPDSVADFSFRRAREIDPRGANLAFHLLVDALTTGDLETAAPLYEEVLSAQPDTFVALEIALLDRCARRTMTIEQWADEMGARHYEGLEAAKQFARGGRNPDCAEGAFRAVLLDDGVSSGDRQAAFRGLQGVLLNSGRSAEALALIDAATQSLSRVQELVADPDKISEFPTPGDSSEGSFQLIPDTGDTPNHLDGAAYALTLIQAAAGVELGDRPDRLLGLLQDRYGPDFTVRTPTASAFYRLGLITASRGRVDEAERIAAQMEVRFGGSSPSTDVAWTQAVRAHVTLAAGDTTLALERFESLRTEGSIGLITWNHSAPLPLERIVEARLHLAQGTTEGARKALDLASSLDGEPLGYTPYLAESLAIRIEAAEALGQPALADMLRSRRAALSGSGAAEGT